MNKQNKRNKEDIVGFANFVRNGYIKCEKCGEPVIFVNRRFYLKHTEENKKKA